MEGGQRPTSSEDTTVPQLRSCDALLRGAANTVKEEIETRFPAFLKRTQVLSAQIASSNIGIAHWQREAAEAKKTSREAWTQMTEMRDKYMDLLAQLNSMRQYVKYMPEQTRKDYDSARREAMRMIYGDFER